MDYNYEGNKWKLDIESTDFLNIYSTENIEVTTGSTNCRELINFRRV
jgi:hypothetical protein